MKISRQTFQRILSDARSKIANALINGRAIRVSGGDFTQQVCRIICPECNKEWEESYENFKTKDDEQYKCPNCGYEELTCCGRKKGEFCAKRCCGKT